MSTNVLFESLGSPVDGQTSTVRSFTIGRIAGRDATYYVTSWGEARQAKGWVAQSTHEWRQSIDVLGVTRTSLMMRGEYVADVMHECREAFVHAQIGPLLLRNIEPFIAAAAHGRLVEVADRSGEVLMRLTVDALVVTCGRHTEVGVIVDSCGAPFNLLHGDGESWRFINSISGIAAEALIGRLTVVNEG